MTTFKFFIFACIFGTFNAQALPLPRGPRALVQLPATFTESYDFEGIVQLSNCSGSLIRLENGKDSDFGLILTNGHCYERGFPPPGQAYHDLPSTRQFGLMDSQGGNAGDVSAIRLIYSTMTKTDISIYQLSETYADILRNYGVRPLTLSSQHSNPGQGIQVISGYWQRGYTCAIDNFVNQLEEEGYLWSDSIRYSRPGCEVIGGTSGSPIIATGTRTVIGVNNTGNESGERCTENNPCEIDKSGNVTYEKGLSYGQETYWIYSCVNAQGEISVNTLGCLLPH